jgi:hypothetical protein
MIRRWFGFSTDRSKWSSLSESFWSDTGYAVSEGSDFGERGEPTLGELLL